MFQRGEAALRKHLVQACQTSRFFFKGENPDSKSGVFAGEAALLNVCVRVCVCVCVHIHTHTHIDKYVYIYIYIHTHTYILCTYVYMYIHVTS